MVLKDLEPFKICQKKLQFKKSDMFFSIRFILNSSTVSEWDEA